MNNLLIGDLHLGSGRSLAACSELWEVLEPELQWADRLIINGDLIHTAPLKQVLLEAAPWCSFVADRVEGVVLVPGNHEYGLLGQGRRRAQIGLCEDESSEVLALLEALFPSCQREVQYPRFRVEEVEVVHGHQLIAAIKYRDSLELLECDRILLPYFEAFWVLSQRPESITQPLFDALVLEMGRITPPEASEIRAVSECASSLSDLLQVDHVPAGRVVFGHLHQQIEELPAGPYIFSNPGGWLLDSYVQKRDPDPLSAHPGGVIRISEGVFEHRRLLDGYSWGQLQGLVDSQG